LPWRTLVSSGVSDASGPAFCRAVLFLRECARQRGNEMRALVA
jgi:hypothetical protein